MFNKYYWLDYLSLMLFNTLYRKYMNAGFYLEIEHDYDNITTSYRFYDYS